MTPGALIGPGILGGASPRACYEAGLSVLHSSNDPKLHLTIPVIEVEAIPLSGYGIDALIGRDVLAACVLVYDGPAGSITLAY